MLGLDRHLMTVAAALIVGAAVASGCSSGPKVGAPAPAFTAVDAEGTSIDLAAFEGQVLILDFWAVW